MGFKAAEDCLNEIKYEISLYHDYVSEVLIEETVMLAAIIRNESVVVKKDIVLDLIQASAGKPFTKVLFYSFAIDVVSDSELLVELLEMLLQTEAFKVNTLYFLHWQIQSMLFLKKDVITEDTLYLSRKLLERIYEKFKSELGERANYRRLSIGELNQDVAIVITGQLLATDHGPTKTVLDRCYTLMKRLGKQVILINTAEVLTMVGKIPFWNMAVGSYIEGLKSASTMEWRGVKIPYLQCDQNMPNLDALKYLLDVIYEMKPGIIVSVGHSSILGGLVNDIVPVLVVGTTTSGIVPMIEDYQIVPQKLDNSHINVFRKLGRGENSLIKGRFTFSLKEQEEFLERNMLGFPEQKFLLCVVGGRLDEEITEEFLAMLEGILSEKIAIVFIGEFQKYETLCQKYEWFRENSYNLGWCSDILSRVELCDLYVNPERRGGGTSCVEAMYKGLPVITTEYGDVAGIVGNNFSCHDYMEMGQIIQQYVEDKEFYKKQSAIAEKLAAEYMDSETEFERCINVYLERMREAEH